MSFDWTAFGGTVGGLLGGGGLVAWRNSRNDAAKLALDIAREAKAETEKVSKKLDSFIARAVAHQPWDWQAASEIRKLGGHIDNPPPLFTTE
jgi:hypothetical protein